MKIAITSLDGTIEGNLDERFGRTSKFIIYDTDSKDTKVVDNVKNMNAAQGAGIQSAQNIINEGVQAVISGHLGPNAFRVLQSSNIDIYSSTSKPIIDIIKAFEDGKLEKFTSADKEGHW